ncbi:hypothetical protein EDD22DRAFT_981887 [Suillus occidentalis]|nr:hypothetical protein EDD22DRAFT_981887 [Suillus occidentalis]
MAVSVDLLSFYCMLFERSCDAINTLASALKNHYSQRGYQMTEAQHQVETVVQQHHDHIAEFQASSQVSNSPLPTQCAPLLVQQCPACFAGILHGRSTDEGGDIHVTMDSNFHHCHRCAAGDCPNFYDPTYFLLKTFVDTIGHHIDTQCKQPVRSHIPLVPDEAVDQLAMDRFDDTGIMALICHHDIPLFFANIDSPGEQQKYLLVYNPRIYVGLGLSDGKGTECLWSHLVQLIGVECTYSVSVAIASEIQGIKGQGSAAQDALDQCEVSIEELQAKWSQQRQSQLSIHAHKFYTFLNDVAIAQ